MTKRLGKFENGTMCLHIVYDNGANAMIPIANLI